MSGQLRHARRAGVGQAVVLSGSLATTPDLDNAISRHMIESESAVRDGWLAWRILRPVRSCRAHERQHACRIRRRVLPLLPRRLARRRRFLSVATKRPNRSRQPHNTARATASAGPDIVPRGRWLLCDDASYVSGQTPACRTKPCADLALHRLEDQHWRQRGVGECHGLAEAEVGGHEPQPAAVQWKSRSTG
jgi:hypothetical protein